MMRTVFLAILIGFVLFMAAAEMAGLGYMR